MKLKKIDILIIVLCTLVLIGTAAVYPLLPKLVPSHWNIKGEIDAYNAKWSVFITALLPLLIYLLMKGLPHIDPKRHNYAKNQKAYDIIMMMIVLVMAGVQTMVLVTALGASTQIHIMMPAVIGVMLIVMGNYMPQIKPNYFLGIKTPWTLASETVWKKTHKIGGYGFVLIGVLFIVQAFYTNVYLFTAVIVILLLFVVFTFVYSYLLFKQEGKKSIE